MGTPALDATETTEMTISERAATITTNEVAAAREWLLELDGESFGEGFDQDEYVEMVGEMTTIEVTRAIARHYDGGWTAFLAVGA